MTARPPERDELESVLAPLLDFAQQQLAKYGEFFRFGCVMTTDGDVRLVNSYPGGEHPPSQDVIDLLVEGMKRQAAVGEIRAIGICFDARTKGEDGKPGDAITVSLEHLAGDNIRVLLPYSKGRFTGYRFGELLTNPGAHLVFPLTKSGDTGGH